MIPLAIFAAGALLALAVFFSAHFERVLTSRRTKVVLVTCKDGSSWRGVLFATDRAALVLRNCEAVEAGADRSAVPVDGELVLLRPDVSHMQFI